VSGGENLSPQGKLEKFSLALWFAKPLAVVRRRWRGRPVRLACQTYVRGPVEVVGVLGKAGRAVREAAGIQ
jgi:ferredoxin